MTVCRSIAMRRPAFSAVWQVLYTWGAWTPQFLWQNRMVTLTPLLPALSAALLFWAARGNVWGTLIGAFIIQVIRNGCNLLKLSTDLQQIVIGAIIIIAVFIDVLRGEMEQKNKLQAIAKANEAQDEGQEA